MSINSFLRRTLNTMVPNELHHFVHRTLRNIWLTEMTEWMYYSLGVDGIIVYPSEVDHMLNCWKCLFAREDRSDKLKCEIDQNNVGGDTTTKWRSEVSWGTSMGHYDKKILDNEIHNDHPQQRQYPLEGEAEGKHVLQRG